MVKRGAAAETDATIWLNPEPSLPVNWKKQTDEQIREQAIQGKIEVGRLVISLLPRFSDNQLAQGAHHVLSGEKR